MSILPSSILILLLLSLLIPFAFVRLLSRRTAVSGARAVRPVLPMLPMPLPFTIFDSPVTLRPRAPAPPPSAPFTIRHSRFTACRLVLLCCLATAFTAGAQDTAPRSGAGGYWDFETWEWAPIPPELGNALRPLKLKGIDINLDYRGPAYRRWTRHGISGHMIEGEAAFKGKSVLVNNPAYEGNTQHLTLGYHCVFNRVLKPGVTYAYEVAVRGEGFFIFQASVQGIEPLTGKTKWLGFPDLIKEKLTSTWEVRKGTFRLPDYQDPNYRPEDLISCAVMVPPGNVVYFDELRITRQATGSQ